MSSGYQSIERNENEVPSEETVGTQENLIRDETESDSVEDVTSSESQPLIRSRREFLDPDDPKVSPLNLYKVRFLRIVLIVLVTINSILFFAFLLTDFIAIPGFNNRGKSFFELDLTILNILTDLITLWCFAIPVYYERVLGYVSALLLTIDFIVVFLVPYARSQFGLLGNFMLLWSIGNLVFNCYIDYYVEKSKEYQEIRFTGRVENRRTVLELAVIFVKLVTKVVVLWLIWNISFSTWLQAFDSHQKPWGKMVGVNNDQFKVHLSCYGDVHGASDDKKSQQPIVLVEGGQLTSSEVTQEWVEELYHLNKIQRYCIWDRPGYGFSDSAPSPISMGIITEYLIEALRKEKIEGPFSVVGFDIGGLYGTMFASRNPGKVHSLLYVDSWHEDLLKKNPFSNGKKESNRTFKNILELMNTSTGFKLWIKGIVSPLGIMQSIHWLFHPRRHSSNDRIFGSDMYYSSKYIRARLQEQVTSSILSYNEIKGADIHDLPVSVISSDFMIKNSPNWGKWQRQLTQLSDNTIEWVIAENSNHFIWESPKGKEQLQQLLLRLVSEKSNY